MGRAAAAAAAEEPERRGARREGAGRGGPDERPGEAAAALLLKFATGLVQRSAMADGGLKQSVCLPAVNVLLEWVCSHDAVLAWWAERLSARALVGLLRALDLLQLRLNMLNIRGGKGCFAFVLMEDRELKGCELFESIPREYPPWACPPLPPTPAELAKRLFRVKVSVGNTREMVERELAGAPADGDSGKRSSSQTGEEVPDSEEEEEEGGGKEACSQLLRRKRARREISETK